MTKTEYLLVYPVILDFESFHDISKKGFLARHLRIFLLIESVFLLQRTLLLCTEDEGKKDVIDYGKGYRRDKKHQYPAYHSPH